MSWSRRSILEVDFLDVLAGEVLAVVGPNGAGKSTLLQVMALLQRPGEGQVLFDGQPARPGSLGLRRRMATVFQEPLLLEGTVEYNVRCGLAMRGVPRREQERRAALWLERFGVAHLAGRSVHSLSGGEAQRVSLARALALEPDVLLLDEPFAALDAPTRGLLMDDLDQVLAERGTTTVFVTHDRSEALRLGDRVAVLMNGRVRQCGTPSEVFAAPADAEVAAFVGVETIVSGQVREISQGLALVDVCGRTVEAPAASRPGAGVLVCLRPEDVVLEAPAEGVAHSSARNRLPAVVRRALPAGPLVRVELDAGFPLVALVTRQSAGELALAPGVPVVASFKATAVHLIPRRREGVRGG